MFVWNERANNVLADRFAVVPFTITTIKITPMPRLTWLGTTFLTLLLTACGGSQTDDTASGAAQDSATRSASANAPVPPGIAAYCVQPGNARAQQITAPDFKLEGPNAIAGQGDFLLASSQAMFAISGLGEQKTYYHYPGILVDAVAVDRCQQSSQEHFFELPLMIGKLSPLNQPRSIFRAFQAQQIQVINDGSDGKAAIVRATGVDNYYWLLELTLMGEALLKGEPKFLSDPFDLKIVVDYILEPDSPTLNIKYRLINTRAGFNSFNIAFVLMASGEGPVLNDFSAFDLDLEGLALQHGIPWVSTNENGSAYVVSARTDALTTTQISGVNALLDARQLANTYLGQLLTAAGTAGDSFLQQFDITVSSGNEFDAVKAHLQHAPKASGIVETPLQIRVTDSISGDPIPGATIEFQTQKQRFLQDWPWETFLTAYADENGQFNDRVPLFRYLPDQPYRVLVSVPGRAGAEPVVLAPVDQTDGTAQVFDIAPAEPLLPVTYQPPHRSSNGLRWSGTEPVANDLSSPCGRVLSVMSPGTPSVSRVL